MEQASWGRSPTSPTCQRMFPMHSTRATIRLARPILPAPDCIRCTARYAEVRYHRAPSDHRIRLAKTAARFYPGWRLACRALVFFTARVTSRSSLWGCNRTCTWLDITTHARSSYNPHFLPAMNKVSATEAATCGCLRNVGPELAESSCRSSRRNLRPSVSESDTTV